MKRPVSGGTPRLWKTNDSCCVESVSDQAKQVILEAYHVAGKTADNRALIAAMVSRSRTPVEKSHPVFALDMQDFQFLVQAMSINL